MKSIKMRYQSSINTEQLVDRSSVRWLTGRSVYPRPVKRHPVDLSTYRLVNRRPDNLFTRHSVNCRLVDLLNSQLSKCQSVYPLTCLSVDLSINRPVDLSTCQAINLPARHPFNLLTCQAVDRYPIYLLFILYLYNLRKYFSILL